MTKKEAIEKLINSHAWGKKWKETLNTHIRTPQDVKFLNEKVKELDVALRIEKKATSDIINFVEKFIKKRKERRWENPLFNLERRKL